MKKTENLKVKYRGQTVGRLSLTPDNHLNVFEYDKSWIAGGFSIFSFYVVRDSETGA